MSDPWVTYEDGDAGFAIEHSPGWETADDAPGCVVLVITPEPGVHGFRANVTLTTAMLGGAMDAEGFASAQLATLGELLTDARLVDRAPASLLDRPGERVLLTYRQGLYSLALEQRWSVAGEGAVVLSATCASLDYDRYAETFARMAASLRVVAAEGGDTGA